MMTMKMFFVFILQLSTLNGILGVPCGYEHPRKSSSWSFRKHDAWQCPNDTICIQKQDVCAPPPHSIPRCPNGGDFGNDSCTEELCESIGQLKCPFDPYCVDLGDYANGDEKRTCLIKKNPQKIYCHQD